MKRAHQGDSTTAVAYLRVSTTEQHLGPEAQRAAIEAWALRAGVNVVAWHEDNGVSGATPLERRPGLLAAVDALVEHSAGVLVVAKRDRLARDVLVGALVERMVQRAGAKVSSAAGEGTEGDDPSSMLMRRMLDAFAEHERLVIRARTRAALAVKRGKGERIGTVPYGMQLAADGRTLEANAAEQGVLARVRAARARGLTLRAVVAELERVGCVSRTGRPFQLRQVALMAQRAAA